ncbi:carbohydrate binding domain-containing protein [candidate division KSB1 bacterium]|nr:carbohydrate binding domain-containing protein [candidate division KSB1 bacterium]
MFRSIALFTFIIYILHFTLLPAQNFDRGFEFYLPHDDTTSQKFLPQFKIDPIEPENFVHIQDGHFAVKGERIRFFGTNSVAEGAFPDLSKSDFVAGRLRKMGFNLIRFHHLDNGWSSQSLFEWDQDTRHLNPATLDRLEKYIYELKRNGIYINMNLHVSRTFKAQDGVTAADSILNFGKGVTYFDRKLIDLQKEYAEQLLTHVNPYTKLGLKDDPVMAMVEITNENSLYRMWRSGAVRWQGNGGDFPNYHVHLLDSLWTDYLRSRYTDTEALKTAWNQGIRPAGADEQVKDGGFENDPITRNWVLEQHETAKAVMSIDETNPYEGSRCAHVYVTNSDGTGWHIQWKQVNIKIVQDSLSTVSFAGRADGSRNISVAIQKDSSPWTVFYSASFGLNTQWQEFQFSFRAPATNTDTRLSFSLGEAAGNYWFDDIHLGTSAIQGLVEGESLENGTIRRIDYSECVNFSDNRVRDISRFYHKLQQDYFTEMSDFLIQLGVRVPITGTNWNVGPGDMVLQSQLDYIDNHSYWDHPSFPNQPWSSTDWTINNTPMVKDDAGGTIAGLFSKAPHVGKPMTVSEYNHPFPNRYQSEGVLFITGYSAFHDTDGPMFFDYGGSQNNWDTDRVDGYFGIHRNTAMMCLIPSCAHAFRTGTISPAEQTIEISYSTDDLLLLPKKDNMHWTGPQLYSDKIALQHAVRNKSYDSPAGFDETQLPPEPVNPYASDTGEIIWNSDGLLQVAAPQFIGLTGFLQDFTGHWTGLLTLREATDFATLTWISLTEDKLQDSPRSLITLSTKIQNNGMVWDGTTTVHDRWGSEPTEMCAVRIKLLLFLHADSIRIYPLDETGATTSMSRLLTPVSNNYFEIVLDQNEEKTVWWGIEKFGEGTGVNQPSPDSEQPFKWALERNYPNPFNAGTKIPYTAGSDGRVTISVFNIQGREVRCLVNQRTTKGKYLVTWDGRDRTGWVVPSGVYFIKMKAGDMAWVQKVVFVK